MGLHRWERALLVQPHPEVIPTNPPSLHNQMDGLLMDGEQMFVGLMGWDGSSAGFQSFDPALARGAREACWLDCPAT